MKAAAGILGWLLLWATLLACGAAALGYIGPIR